MNTPEVVFALALLAGANADSVRSSTYATSSTCEGQVAMYSSSLIDCETNAGASYAIKCRNSTSAQLMTYAYTDDCSGDPTVTLDYPLDFGCLADGTASALISCEAGAFVAPTPAANTYAYNGINSCPPTGGDLTMVLTYPCGHCIGYGSGSYGMYSCDSSNVKHAFYHASDCSGTPFSSETVESTGCSATSTQVTVTSCDMGNSTKKPAVSPLKEPASALAAREAARLMAEHAADVARAALKA
mmetsp:Transcript_76841/g.150596  ORF Transcript_76841/g.150596 Transcript_76841/m.150596 type:complete len:244 (+) Transcript_76841:21-752(+)